MRGWSTATRWAIVIEAVPIPMNHRGGFAVLAEYTIVAPHYLLT